MLSFTLSPKSITVSPPLGLLPSSPHHRHSFLQRSCACVLLLVVERRHDVLIGSVRRRPHGDSYYRLSLHSAKLFLQSAARANLFVSAQDEVAVLPCVGVAPPDVHYSRQVQISLTGHGGHQAEVRLGTPGLNLLPGCMACQYPSLPCLE